MKTSKEYPATHSMSTTWYAVDEDGNVGIIDFNDNGPIPFDIPSDIGFNDVALDKMIINSESFPQQLNYTPEQALVFIKGAKHINENKDLYFYNSIVQINANKEDLFLEILSKYKKRHPDDIIFMVLSKELGIYYLQAFIRRSLKKIFKEKIVIKFKELDFWFKEEKHNNKWRYIPINKHVPFFVYKQPYFNCQLIERTSIPKHPVKIDQIPNGAKKIIHLPFKFSKTKQFQIAEFCKVKLFTSYVTIDGIERYHPMPLTNGGEAFFHENKKMIDYIPLDEAFENHKVEIDYGNEGFSYFGRIEYIINGKRGYFLSNEDKNEYYRIGSDTTIIKTTKNDKVEIFDKCKMRK